MPCEPDTAIRPLRLSFLALLLLLPAVLCAADRVALVLGNAAYPGDPDAPDLTKGKLIRLDSAAQDVKVMSAALRKVGFTVETGQDLTAAQMGATVTDFAQKYAGTRDVVFYFSGHGAQVAGENYLTGIDSDADLDREVLRLEAQYTGDDLKRQLETVEREAAEKRCLPLRLVLANLQLMTPRGLSDAERARHTRVILLDACRSPFDSTGATVPKGTVFQKGGLAPGDSLKRAGVFIGFAAAANEVSFTPKPEPGQPTLPSLFTKHFEERLQQPGEIGTLFKEARLAVNAEAQKLAGTRQFPAYYDELETPFAFVPGGGVAPPPPVVTAADRLRAATKDSPWVNTLGVEFVPVPGKPGVFMCRTETRVRDFRAFATATDLTQNGGAYGMKVVKKPDGGHTTNWEVDAALGWDKPGFAQTEDHPVTCVSWVEARDFCQWLGRQPGERGVGYRLPSDAEWSAAAGSLGKYPWGDEYPPKKTAGKAPGNYWDLQAVKNLPGSNWESTVFDGSGYDDGAERTARVGSYPANRFGFLDLGGNVWEWCADYYRDSLNDPDVVKELKSLGFDDGGGQQYRVLRGGSWRFDSEFSLRSSFRDFVAPTARFGANGFRVVVEVGSGGEAP